jgi:hypothetical protein
VSPCSGCAPRCREISVRKRNLGGSVILSKDGIVSSIVCSGEEALVIYEPDACHLQTVSVKACDFYVEGKADQSKSLLLEFKRGQWEWSSVRHQFRDGWNLAMQVGLHPGKKTRQLVISPNGPRKSAVSSLARLKSANGLLLEHERPGDVVL